MYIFSAKVVRGGGGKKIIGFPTANLDKINLNLNYGVYLVEVEIKDKKYRGLLHFGPKKTFNNIISAEVFIKDFDSNIYGKKLKVKVIKKIRKVKKFKNVKSLVGQIRKDIRILGN